MAAAATAAGVGSEMIWKIWKKGKSNSDKIWPIWKKDKLNSEKI
jgi:hypothetical protein